MPWGKVMRRTLFERAGFPEGYWFEDSVLHQLILPGAQGCIGIADTVVERRLAAQSAGHISRGRNFPHGYTAAQFPAWSHK